LSFDLDRGGEQIRRSLKKGKRLRARATRKKKVRIKRRGRPEIVGSIQKKGIWKKKRGRKERFPSLGREGGICERKARAFGGRGRVSKRQHLLQGGNLEYLSLTRRRRRAWRERGGGGETNVWLFEAGKKGPRCVFARREKKSSCSEGEESA